MTKPFRFGVQVRRELHARGVRHEGWHTTEELGYSTFYFPDHFIDTELAPMVAMAIAAAVTTTLHVGALVFDNDYKHPAILAKEIATLDVLSGGRTELGIGAGWMEVDYDRARPAVRPAGCADRPPGRGARRSSRAATARSRSASRARTTRSPTTTASRSRPSSRTRRSSSVAAARGCCASPAREADIVGINPNLRAGAVTARRGHGLARGDDRPEGRRGSRRARASRFDDLELQIRYFLASVTDDRQDARRGHRPGVRHRGRRGARGRHRAASGRSTRSATSWWRGASVGA